MNITDEISVSIHKGTGKKSGKDYEAVRLKIGEYETFIFPTKFELRYIKEMLSE